MATARLVATFLMSLGGGFITHFMMKKWGNKYEILKPGYASCTDGSCEDESQEKTKKDRVSEIIKLSFQTILFVMKFLVIAFVLEAVILFYVPEEVVLNIFTSNRFLSTIIATIISVPLYTTNLSALGLVAGLLEKGLNGGAGLAFLVGGATTTIPAMSAVFRLVNKKIFALYLGITFVFTILSGLIFDIFFATG